MSDDFVGLDARLLPEKVALADDDILIGIEPDGSGFKIAGENIGAGGGGGASALDELTDVQVSSPTTGHVLRHNGTHFVNGLGTSFFDAAGTAAAGDVTVAANAAAATNSVQTALNNHINTATAAHAASAVAIVDAGTHWDGVNVEAVLQEVGEAFNSVVSLTPGGATGAALVKLSGTNFDAAWVDLAATYVKLLTGDRVNGQVPMWDAGAAQWTMASIAGGTAEGTTISDPDDLFSDTVTNVEQALAVVKAATNDQVRATGGGLEKVDSHPNAGAVGNTAIVFDLANGNVHEVTSTGGNYTVTVANPGASGRATSLTAFITTTANVVGHIPTFNLTGLTWPNGAPPTAAADWMAATTRIVSFVSLNGGTTWTGFYLTPRPSLQSIQFSYPGTFPTASTTVPVFPGVPNSSGLTRVIERITAHQGTGGTGVTGSPITDKAVILDVHTGAKGATATLWNTQANRLAFDSGSTALVSSLAFNQGGVAGAANWLSGHVLEIYFDRVGDTIAGADLVLEVSYREGA